MSDERAAGRDRMDQGAARILMFSQRNIYDKAVWRCSFHEFEGILEKIDAVETVAPSPRWFYPHGKRLASIVGRHFRAPINPGIPVTTVSRDYDMFFAVCEKPSELLNLRSIRGIRDHCKTSVCWLTEFYVKDIPTFKSCVEVLSDFDLVVFMFDGSQPFEAALKGRAIFLPGAVDALRFCPFPNAPERSIDVLSIGRRSPDTHVALRAFAERNDLFYLYDTFTQLDTGGLCDHRALLANKIKRSRYFIANPGKIDRPDETGGQSEFGFRYFEGAAGGAVVIGARPDNPRFAESFDWEDALIDLPFGSLEIGSIIADLDRQPERVARIRQDNVVQSLLRHDWVYRWETLLSMADLEPLEGAARRKARLSRLASEVSDPILLRSDSLRPA